MCLFQGGNFLVCPLGLSAWDYSNHVYFHPMAQIVLLQALSLELERRIKEMEAELKSGRQSLPFPNHLFCPLPRMKGGPMYALLRMALRCPGLHCLVRSRCFICLLRMVLSLSPLASWQFGFTNTETFSLATLCKWSAKKSLAIQFQSCSFPAV